MGIIIERDERGRFVKGHIGWNNGKHLSAEHKRKISQSNKGKFKIIISEEELRNLYLEKKLSTIKIGKLYKTDPSTILYRMDLFGIKRRARSESLKGRVVTEETRRKISKANKGRHHSPPTEFKEGHPPYFKPTKEMWQKAAEAHRKFYLSKDELADLYEKRGLSAPQIAEMIGVTTTTVVDWLKRFQIPIRSNAESTRLLWERSEYVKKQKSWARKKLSEDAKKRLSESLKRIYSHPLLRQKMREQTKNLWKKLDYREKVLKNTLKAVHKRPTHAEEILLRIIKKHHFPFKYVGDGQVIIGCLNPDFIHCDGQKKVIEVFGRVYHDPEVSFLHLDWKRQPFGRIAYYAQFGYDCLILWDDELEDEEKVVERVKSWT